MEPSLALTALLMGLAGGPHCLAMCGAACAALGPRGGPAGRVIPLLAQGAVPAPGAPSLAPAQWLFLGGRLVGYTGLGALAAASVQALGWLSVQSAALRPVWTLLHVAAALVGLLLLWQARQPAWLDLGARRVWTGLQGLLGEGRPARSAPLVMGLAWSLLPCGLLYSALLVAALSPGIWQGAVVMALFALGSGLGLLAGPWLWQRLRGQGSGRWAIRLAGAALLATSVWALWHGLVLGAAPWCAPAA